MGAVYVQEGESIDYTPGSAVATGDVVVIGDLVGIANHPIAANTLGSLQIEGVYDLDKTASEEITAGSIIYWDDSEDEASALDTYADVIIGIAIEDSAAADTTVRVKLTPGIVIPA